jgi:hypothetical protein
LGPILFTAYTSPVAAIASRFQVNQQQYADDTQLHITLIPASLSASLDNLQNCLLSLQTWFVQNGLALNPGKTEAICIGTSSRRNSLQHLVRLQVLNSSIPLSDHIKLIGVTFDSALSFSSHVSNICREINYHIRALRRIRTLLDLDTAKSISSAIIGSRLDYANSLLHGIPAYNIKRLQRAQNALARVVAAGSFDANSSAQRLAALHWLPIQQRISFKLCTLVHSSINNASHLYLSSLIHKYTQARHLRSADHNLLFNPRSNTTFASRAFRSAGPHLWNSLPVHLRILDSDSSFKSQL